MSLLNQIAVLLIAAVVAVPLAKKVQLGSVIGYLGAGLLVGPFGVHLITEVQSILHFSEFGVVLLLFLIGLELNPSRLWVMRRTVFGLGGAQVVATALALAAFGLLLGVPRGAALIAGFGLALSSTAFVLPILAEKNQLSTPHGNAAFAILLFQDLAVIPLLVILPLLGMGGAPAASVSALGLAVKIGVALVGLVLVGRYLLRRLFTIVASSGNQEIMTAMALLVVLGTALIMRAVGLSMSLGAFLAGVLLAESEYRHELQADIEPFKGLLLGLFFMAVGMSANLGIVAQLPLQLLAVVLGFMTVKALIIYGLYRWMGERPDAAVDGTLRDENPREQRAVGGGSSLLCRMEGGRERPHFYGSGESARHIATALPQGGEFAFVLFAIAAAARVMTPRTADFLVVAVTLSMVLTPLWFAFDDKVLSRWAQRGTARDFDAIEEPPNLVVIAGFGRVGQIVGRVLRLHRIGFTALDGAATHVDFVRKFGNKIYYGDATRLDLLRAAQVDKAKIFVLAIDDVIASIKVAELVLENFSNVTVYARARNRQHAYQLLAMGINLLVRETFDASLALAEQVLVGTGVSPAGAQHTVQRFAQLDIQMMRATYVYRHDEAKLVQATKQYAAELETLFAADAKTMPVR